MSAAEPTEEERGQARREHVALERIDEAIRAHQRFQRLSLEHLADMLGEDIGAFPRHQIDGWTRAKAEEHVHRWLEREAGS